MLRNAATVFALSLLALPLLLRAQEDTLRAQIRADLARDSRTAAMSSIEIDALVDALALRAEEEGTAGDYLDSQNTFDYSSLFTAGTSETSASQIRPLFIALLSLAAILLMVGIYVVRNRGSHRGELSDIAA